MFSKPPSNNLINQSFWYDFQRNLSNQKSLKNEKKPRRRLEAAVKADQEWVVGGRLEDVLLSLNPIDVLKTKNNFNLILLRFITSCLIINKL